MKKFCALCGSLILVVGLAVSPVFAGGGKNQHEIGAPDALGPGDDAQGNQAD